MGRIKHKIIWWSRTPGGRRLGKVESDAKLSVNLLILF